ncbi:hypothetical protein KHQ82_04690 [Mycoplasmatota bacterium]|nr:hypothetical protein KHQ82_04690 [Mycoplasmatota bacterium]
MNLILYFTRSGTCKKVSEILSQTIDSEVLELKDNMNWRGLLGFIKGGYHSFKESRIEYDIKEIDFSNYDQIYIVSPIWASKVQPTIRTFIKENNLQNAQLILVQGMRSPNENTIRNNLFITRKKTVYLCHKEVYKTDFNKNISRLF